MSPPENQHEGIAIIGMAGRFPGARNTNEFWRNLSEGAETITALSDAQLATAGLEAAKLRAAPDYVAARGLIERPEWFDAAFFGITPKEAEVMDPQQRVFLEEAWTALEDAGCDPARYAGAIGVFAGMSNNTYFANNVAGHAGLIESVGSLTAMMGNEKDYLATRVAYKLNLKGPALNIYTACSTSLVAVCQACSALLNYQCDAALAGGVSITFPQERGYTFQDGGITSPDGHCRAFDERAAGTVFSSGVGIVVLKRLAEAIADGDQIYAVIKGSALNNDGSQKVSFTAPSVDGHAEVIALAQVLAGFPPETISYIEAHGTGTPLGDPIEIAGLTQAFRAGTEAKGFCAIGSLKTNIGHLDAAAGVAGLIKTALALRHGKIPASLHFTAPNPQLELESTPFFVNTALRDWPMIPRRAGVSSFGVGGTNAHVVLEEAPAPTTAAGTGPQLLVLSARSLRALEDATTNLGNFLRAHPDLPLADVAFTLQRGRHSFAFRRFVVANNTAEAGNLLLRRDRRRVFTTPVRGTAEIPANADELALPGHRWIAGEEAGFPRTTGRKISLPTYPFERQRYWAEPQATTLPAAPAPAPEPAVPSDTFAALKAELTALSGLDASAATAETTLIDLGFDSLFLTQIAMVLQKKFGVRLRFRQFFDELGTLGALAEYLRANQTAVTPERPPVTAPATAAPAKPVAHGPFRRIDTGTAPEFTPQQQAHLDDLIARYTKRTAESKRLTAAHRPYLADPRAVAGFKRAWKEMVYPLVAERSLGSKLWDVDGHEYVDVTLGFGQNLLGHRPPFVVDAVAARINSGIEIGPTSPLAGQVAALMRDFTGLDRVAFCNTGSEAVTAAIRVARTVTGRSKIALFAGAYHGIFDEVLVRPGPDHTAVPIAPGIEPGAVENVLVLEYGTEAALAALRAHAHEIAAVLVEPVQSRRPDLQPGDFLHKLRQLATAEDIALVFDEVVTGFRIHPGGAQAWFGVKADIATYGKVVGGGLPIGIVAGAARFMDALDGGVWNYGDDSFPEVGVTFFAGTFVRHPMALAAAKAVLEHLRAAGPTLQETLNERTAGLVDALNAHLATRGVPLQWTRFASMYFLAVPPELKHAGLLWYHLRARGIHAWEGRPSFLSTAHTEADVARIIEAFKESVDELQGAGFLPSGGLVVESFAGPEFPLTDAQQELLLATQMGGEASASFNESITIHLHGKLDAASLRGALGRLVARHEALRTTFSDDGETQRVAPSRAVELPLVDLTALDADAQAHALNRRIETESTAPFDLAHGPLLRAALVKLAEDRHDLVLTVHHIVCDGWSFANAAADLAALYSGRPLAAPCAFREYARWLREKQTAPEFAATEAFWLRQFAELPPPMELPADHPRGKERTYRGARCATMVPQELHEGLKRFSAAQRCTLFTTMLAAFHVLLHRLTGQDDLVVGIAAAGQAAMGRADLTGHCLNFLPIRARMAENPDFTTFLGALQTLVLDAFDHQDQTFGALLRKLALPRDASRMPLLGATFNIDRSSAGLDFAGLSAEFDINPKLRLGLELSFNLIETERGTQLYCAFNRDLFEPATIDRWLGHYLTLLAGIVAEPATAISRLPILSTAGRERILTQWSGSERPYPQDQTVAARFAECAARRPEALAVIEGGERLTYAELDVRSNRVAHFLQARGIRAGHFVGLRAERSLDFVVKVLGILKAGAAYLPLDEMEPAERLAAMRAACFFTIEGEPEGDLPGSAVASAAEAEGPAYVLFTSGSTGVPKGVIIPHRGITRLVVNNDYAPFEQDDVVAFASNVCFDAATFEIWGALLNGGSLVIIPHDVLLSPSALRAHLAKHQVSVLFLTTSLFNRHAHETPAMFGQLRMLVFGGEAADAGSVRLVLESGRPQRLVNGYGPTETTTFAICHVIGELDGSSVPIGRPIANTRVFLLDRQLEPVPCGVPGEIFIGGPGVALGYLNDPELTAERFLETPFGRLYKTGDLGRYRDDGTIEYCGRIDAQMKLRGFRIEPGEIEAALQRHPGVRQATVTVRQKEDDRWLVAHLVPNGSGTPDDVKLREFLQQHLPAPMVPSAFAWLPALPLTPNGKVDRKALEKVGVEVSAGTDYEPARNELQSKLVAIWQTVLHRERVGIRDNFFALGGHSLLAARLVAEVEKQLKHRLPITALFQSPTVESLAERLNAENWRPPWSSLVPLQTQGDKPPIFFVHGVQGDVYGFLELARLLPADQPSYGVQALGLDGKSERHVTIEAMAAFYVQEITAFQPEGPLFLAGFSMGGVIAYEIAQQLHRLGRRVALLVLLDSGPTGPAPWRYFALARCSYLCKRSLVHLRHLWEGAPEQGWLHYLRHRLASLLHYVNGNRSRGPVVTAPPRIGLQAPAVPGFIDYYHAVASAYELRPYPGPADIFVSEYGEDNWRWYWKWLVRGGVTFHAFPGEHMDFLFNPHGRDLLARFLTSLLERAQQQGQKPRRPTPQPEPSLVT